MPIKVCLQLPKLGVGPRELRLERPVRTAVPAASLSTTVGLRAATETRVLPCFPWLPDPCQAALQFSFP